MAQAAIRLLGSFEASLDGQPVTDFESVKVRLLLAYLAAEAGRPRSRAALAGLLWPDWPETAASKNLRHSLYSLRKSLDDPDWLEADRRQITLAPGEDCRIDTLALESALAAFRRTVNDPPAEAVCGLESAVEGVRGPFLDGAMVKDSPAYETWLLARREHHNQQVLQACALLADWFDRRGKLEKAEGYIRRQITIDPWRESAHQDLMRLLARQGRRLEALAHYNELCQNLAAELNTTPSPETARLAEEIRTSERPVQPQAGQAQPDQTPAGSPLPVSANRMRHNLPEAANRFIGRVQDSHQVKGLFRQHRLVSVVGPGGVGKTRLALNAAREFVPAYRDGVWMVELAGLNEPELLPQVVATTFHLRKNPNESLNAALLDYLRDKRLLLFLDNCEHLIEACAGLARLLLSQCPGLTILATSRERMEIDGEAVFPLQPLRVPEEAAGENLERLLASEAVALFIERGQMARPGFNLTAENAPSIVQICQRLDGIPLALELAAARLPVLPVDQIAQRLDDRFRLLAAGKRAALPHHQTLLASIDWSHALLCAGEQRLLRRLAVFSGGWTLEAAEQVCADGALEGFEILDHLAQLVSKSLVETKLDEGQPRYTMLETIRQYAQVKLEAAGEQPAVRDRHLAYYLEYGETWGRKLQTWEYTQVLRQLDPELENLRQAIQWGYDHPEIDTAEKSLRLASALGWYWDLRGLGGEGCRWLMKGIARLSGVDPEPAGVLAEAYFHAGNLLFYIEDYVLDKGGRSLLMKSISYAEQAGEPQIQAMAQSRMAGFLMNRFFWPSPKAAQSREYEEASRLVNRSLVYLENEDPSPAMAYATYMKGNVIHYAGDYPAARRYLEKALAIGREVGDNITIYSSLLNLGGVLLLMGDYAGSADYYQQGLAWSRELADQHYSLVLFLSGLLSSSLCEGDYPAVYAWGQEAFELSQYFGDKRMGIFAKRMLGIAALRQGRIEQAVKDLLESYKGAKTTSDQYGIVVHLAMMSGVAAALNKPEEAARLLGAADAGIEPHFKPFDLHDRIQIEDFTAQSKEQLGEAAWLASYQAGRNLRLEAAVTEAERLAATVSATVSAAMPATATRGQEDPFESQKV